MYKIPALCMLLLLTSCGCKYPQIEVLKVKNPSDWQMTCQQIEHALDETEFHILSAERKMDNFEIYSPTPLCMLDSYANAKKASESAKDRFAYLNMLYRSKKCAPNSTSSDTNKALKQGYTKIPVM